MRQPEFQNGLPRSIDAVVGAEHIQRMPLVIARECSLVLQEYARVPIAFEVPRGELPPAIKDYDAFPGNGPLEWPNRFDISGWLFLIARLDGRCVGGAVGICRSPEVTMLDGRDDLALLWDIRVAPELRGRGVGSALLTVLEEAVRSRGARELKVETQDINANACRFYQRHGFTIGRTNPDAYPDFPNEKQLLLYKPLG